MINFDFKNITDSRDIETYREELQEKIKQSYDDYVDDFNEGLGTDPPDGSTEPLDFDAWKETIPDMLAELVEVDALLEQLCVGAPPVLIHENHWVEYVEEMVSDIGDLPKKIPGYLVIDWQATADNIAMDYSQVEINGANYFYRS